MLPHTRKKEFEYMEAKLFYIYTGANVCQESTAEIIMHKIQPVKVGISTATAVHFQLPVSLRIVRQVVEHGQ